MVTSLFRHICVGHMYFGRPSQCALSLYSGTHTAPLRCLHNVMCTHTWVPHHTTPQCNCIVSAPQVTRTIIKQMMRMCAEPTHSCAAGPTPVVGIPTVCIHSATQNKSTVCDARFTREWLARDRQECCLDATNYFEIVSVEFVRLPPGGHPMKIYALAR